MLKIIDKTSEIADFLENYFSKDLLDYRISLKIDMEIEVFILVSRKGIVVKAIESEFEGVNKNIFINEILKIELEEDKYLQWLFENKENGKVDLGLRRRLNNLIELNNNVNFSSSVPPITTFYSYKGGMGRSTTLACFASYCAMIKKQRVVIVDCDFEAPGFTNYFDLDPEVMLRKSGIVEYLLDKKFTQNSGEKLDVDLDYAFKVGYEYIGDGDIYIIPAGNLSNEKVREEDYMTHRNHYLEALSRLDISSVDSIVDDFKEFIEDVTEQLKPDIILFDSRTGFNDVFAVLASLSQTIVGFFGNNIQTKTGVEHFLDTFGAISEKKNIFLINSIISGSEYYENFKASINQYNLEHPENYFYEGDNVGSEKLDNIYFINREDNLNKLGTDFAFKKNSDSITSHNSDYQHSYDVNFVNIIEKNTFFQPFFDDLFNSIINLRSTDSENASNKELDTIIAPIEIRKNSKISYSKDNDVSELLNKKEGKISPIELRNDLLNKLIDHMPSRYGDDQLPTIPEFYFRDCMKDMFNRDKFLVIGSKGTGKTFLYQALKNQELQSKLQERSRVLASDKYLFINLISIQQDSNSSKYLETADFGIAENKIQDTDKFFKRFWVIYLWNALMIDENIVDSIFFNNEIEVFPIKNDPSTIKRFKSQIEDDDFYLKIYGVLDDLDENLNNNDINLVVLFEQLDFIVKPEYWPIAISPLINFWRSNPFNRIIPKIFLRADLYNKLTGLTNIQNLSNRSIDIEWTKKELFAYFFKLVLLNCKNDFYLAIYSHFDYSNKEFIEELDEIISNNDNQIPTKDEYLRPLVEVFFGKYANWNNVLEKSNFGESYDWFERNMKDANDKISLRPFLNLIEKAIKEFLNRDGNVLNPKSILSASFYAAINVRQYAVEQHFEDLAKEKGNRALLRFRDYITVDGPKMFKIPVYKRQEFSVLLNNIFTTYKGHPDMADVKKTDDLKYILLSNGIIKETDNTNRVYTNYVIPFLYRSYFRVSTQNIHDRKFYNKRS